MIKKFRITVNGKAYEVAAELLSEANGTTAGSVTAVAESAKISASEVAAAPIKKPSAPKATAGSGDVLSPLSGKVVSIDVKVGATVAEGDKVLTLEAMKMNTFVLASRSGTIKEVLVNVAQAVEEGAVLARIE